MTRVLLRLKLSLLRNSMKVHAGRVGGVVVAYGVALLCGVTVGGLLMWSRGAGDGAARGVTLAVPTILFLGWLTGPIMTSGFDSTVDPAKLAIYPLSRRQMTLGLFAVAWLGGGGVFSFLTMAGVVGATAPIGPLALGSVAAGLSLVGVCVAASRAVAAVISGASRRVRDTLLFVVPLFFMSIGVLPQLLGLGEDETLSDLGHLADTAQVVATVLPSGAAAQAMLAAAEGRTVPLLGWLVLSFGWVAFMLWVWSAALRRLLVRSVAAPAAGGRSRAVPASRALYAAPFRWLPRNRVGAIAAKELRLVLRDPRQRVALLGTVAGSVPFALIGLSEPGPSSLLRIAAVAFFAAANATNLYGFDGASHWMNLAAGDDARSDLAGKCLARFLVAAPVVLILIVGMATAADAWSRALPALCLSLCGIGLGLGPATWVSVTYPWPMPPAQKNVFAGANTGQGVQAVLPMLLIMAAGAAVLFGFGMPLAAGSASPVALLLWSSLAVVTGGLVFALGFWQAVVRSRDRQPELLLALTKS